MLTAYHERLRSIRSRTPDPETDKPYSQAKIAKLLGKSSTYMGTLEAGGIDTPPPEITNTLARLLPYAVIDQLRDMGYDIPDDSSLSDDEKELVQAFRRLPRELRQAVLVVAATLRPTGTDAS